MPPVAYANCTWVRASEIDGEAAALVVNTKADEYAPNVFGTVALLNACTFQ